MNNSHPSIFLEPGTVLSKKYQIIRLIGQGGMGTVYMAYDSSLDLKVAVKVISPEIMANMDEEQYEVTLKRFQAEARIAAQIDHPNVIRIMGFNRDIVEHRNKAIEVDYLVMELLAERTLRDTMDESGFEHEDQIKDWIVKYMIPVLEGLEKVHACGITHRDIKPENFFLKEGRVKLADFGLSMGIDQPSITGSMIDVLGTLKYMAPEQYYNFSLARKPSDIFSLGRILYEAVEGKITEKIMPFTQVHIRTDTPFLKALNEIIAAATAENPKERIASAREFMDRLTDILYCPIEIEGKAASTLKKIFTARYLPLSLLAVIALSMVYIVFHHDEAPVPSYENIKNAAEASIEIMNTPPLKDSENVLHADDNSIMQLIPRLRVNLLENGPLPLNEYILSPFYLSQSPVTNQQFTRFLNTILDKLKIEESDVLLNGKPILKLSEKIRGYKPILFNGVKFEVQSPMHSSCAVLMVTGYGAEAYAKHYGLRLLNDQEWYTLMAAQPDSAPVRLPLPTPVINFSQNTFGIRGINEIAEWGKNQEDSFVVLGQSASGIIAGELVSIKDPDKYYTDTTFRVAFDLDVE